MGLYFNADMAWGVKVADIEEDVPDPYEWEDLPECLDFDTFGDSSEGWTGLVLYLKGTKAGVFEGGCSVVGLDTMMTRVEDFSESDDFEIAVEWCDAHGIDWVEATWHIWASRG